MINVVIIGSGPSALFAAKTILELNKLITITMLEQGKPVYERLCPAEKGKCKHCNVCSVLQGGGGAGLFSDGKLILDLTSGGIAKGIEKLSIAERRTIEDVILKTFKSFDGVSTYKEMPSDDIIEKRKEMFAAEQLSIKFYNVLHMGSYNLPNITQNFINYLLQNYGDRFNIIYNTCVTSIDKEKYGYSVFADGVKYFANSVIAAVGKSGASWLKTAVSNLGVKYSTHLFYFGLRMETISSSIDQLVKLSFDPKISRLVYNRKIKIHCVCRRGQLRYYRYQNAINVGGHSPYNENNIHMMYSIPNANFNILLSYDKSIIPPDKLLSPFRRICPEAVAGQKLSDFILSQTTKTWGKIVPENENIIYKVNIRAILDSVDIDFSRIFIDFIKSLSNICPGIMDGDNILYSPTIEWDMDSVKVDSNMETDSPNLFAVGDGAGLSQGIVFSAATGILAAKEIARRFM